MSLALLAIIILITCHLIFGRGRTPAAGNTDPLAMLKAVGRLLYNKGALILIATIAGQAYVRQNGLPFAELLYLVNVVFSVFIIALVFRLLFFPEVAAFAEDRERFDSALSIGKYPFAMRQYWFGTGISFAVPTLIAIAVF